jgi:hypothetical protein
LKNPSHTHKKRAGGVAQSVGPEFRSQNHKKKKKKSKNMYRSKRSCGKRRHKNQGEPGPRLLEQIVLSGAKPLLPELTPLLLHNFNSLMKVELP